MHGPVKRLKLYETMKSDIASGVYLAGAFLPNEFELAEKYGYSRGTVRSVLAMLEDDKLVELLKGKRRRIYPANVKKVNVPLTFLLPCPDFISEAVWGVDAQDTRRMLRGVSQVAFEYNQRVETVPVSPTNNEHDIDWQKLNFVNADSRVIFVGYWFRELFPLLLERGCRVAFISPPDALGKQYKSFINSCFRITINTSEAAELAVKHLFQFGCRRIALFHSYISEPEHPIMSGYLSGIKKCGLSFAAWHEPRPDENMKLHGTKEQLREFYKKTGGFDGMLVGPEIVNGVRLHNLYDDFGLAENIKIVVSSDLGNHQGFMPRLSGMTFPCEDIGRIAAQHLLATEFLPGEQLISSRLIERESTATFSRREQLVPV